MLIKYVIKWNSLPQSQEILWISIIVSVMDKCLGLEKTQENKVQVTNTTRL